nr:MAG TPA: hypothetical protein [Caudoviricetes sp.]
MYLNSVRVNIQKTIGARLPMQKHDISMQLTDT